MTNAEDQAQHHFQIAQLWLLHARYARAWGWEGHTQAWVELARDRVRMGLLARRGLA